MTEKQKLFCVEYIKTLNGTLAYKTAYCVTADSVAGANANRLLKREDVKEYISQLLKEQKNEQTADIEEIMQFLTSVLRGEVPEEVAVRRAVVTSANQIVAEINEQTMDDLDTEYVETSFHSGARKDHQKWQGQVFEWNNRPTKAKVQKDVNNNVANGGESGIINTGATSGALNSFSKQAIQHAEKYYESVRNMTTDIDNIVEHTGLSKEVVTNAKNHLFMTKHNLGGGKLEYFYPDYEISQSWQKLSNKNSEIQPHDITLLKHENMEAELMAKGYSQQQAHRKTEEIYNYAKEVKERIKK